MHSSIADTATAQFEVLVPGTITQLTFSVRDLFHHVRCDFEG